MAGETVPITQFLINLGTQLPLLLVYLLGFILAIIWHTRYPRPAILTFLAVSLMFLNTIVMTAIQVWLPRFLLEREMGRQDFQLWFGVIGFIRSLIGSIGLLLLLLGVFCARDHRPWIIREEGDAQRPAPLPEARTEKLP